MKLKGVQMLRFAAAMLVAVMHISQAIAEHLTPGQGGPAYWASGSAGVDLFFVISGFVLASATPDAMGPPAQRWRLARDFLLRRVLRVVPLYFFYTGLKVALLLATPGMARRTTLDGPHLLASLLFVPWTSPWGAVEPVLPAGWTLNFEVLFYAVFAVAIGWGLPRLAWCVGVLGAGRLAAWLWPGWTALDFWGSSIALEFALGMALARGWQRRPILPPEVGVLALCLGGVMMFSLPWQPDEDRLLSWGLPATLIVAGAVWLEPWAARLKAAAALAFLGDASYSIYLSHTFVVPAVVRACGALGIDQPALAGLLAVGLVMLVGSLSYVILERPLTLGLQRRLMGTRPGQGAASILHNKPTPGHLHAP